MSELTSQSKTLTNGSSQNWDLTQSCCIDGFIFLAPIKVLGNNYDIWSTLKHQCMFKNWHAHTDKKKRGMGFFTIFQVTISSYHAFGTRSWPTSEVLSTKHFGHLCHCFWNAGETFNFQSFIKIMVRDLHKNRWWRTLWLNTRISRNTCWDPAVW